jgi:hypothetical protein
MENTSPGQVPQYLRSTVDLITIAFPSGLAQDEYLALLGILGAETSFRALADAVSLATGRDYIDVLHDAYGSQSEVRHLYEPPPEVFARVRQRLNEAGYERWRQEEGIDD